MIRAMDIVVLGLSLSSSWGNGHAVTYRALLKALAERGHRILFLERETPWYSAHRDLVTVVGDEELGAGFEEEFDADEGVGD